MPQEYYDTATVQQTTCNNTDSVKCWLVFLFHGATGHLVDAKASQCQTNHTEDHHSPRQKKPYSGIKTCFSNHVYVSTLMNVPL